MRRSANLHVMHGGMCLDLTNFGGHTAPALQHPMEPYLHISVLPVYVHVGPEWVTNRVGPLHQLEQMLGSSAIGCH
eukprot:8607740-Alexandrium_andersonii.AAC.1